MNTARKRITRPICNECDEVYMVVDSTAILLSQPRPPTYTKDPFNPDNGICPKHPRKLTNEQ